MFILFRFLTFNFAELDDGAYNPLWTMRGFTQTFHIWRENRRAQSVSLSKLPTSIYCYKVAVKDYYAHAYLSILASGFNVMLFIWLLMTFFAQVPLNAFLTYITLPCASIMKGNVKQITFR